MPVCTRKNNTYILSRCKRARIPRVTPTGFETPVSVSLPRATQRIVEALQPQPIILFGSYAYGTPTPDSDVDLLLVMRTRATRAERYRAVSRLLRPRPFPVDILVKTPQEIRRALAKGHFFIREIVSQGKVLYERQACCNRIGLEVST